LIHIVCSLLPSDVIADEPGNDIVTIVISVYNFFRRMKLLVVAADQ